MDEFPFLTVLFQTKLFTEKALTYSSEVPGAITNPEPLKRINIRSSKDTEYLSRKLNQGEGLFTVHDFPCKPSNSVTSLLLYIYIFDRF